MFGLSMRLITKRKWAPCAQWSHGPNSPRASYALGHAKQREFKFDYMKSLCYRCPSAQATHWDIQYKEYSSLTGCGRFVIDVRFQWCASYSPTWRIMYYVTVSCKESIGHVNRLECKVVIKSVDKPNIRFYSPPTQNRSFVSQLTSFSTPPTGWLNW